MRARYTPIILLGPCYYMIGDAIRTLAEEGGSTEAAISEYIELNHDRLPLAQDRFLHYYLNMFVAAGKFVAAASGRYLIAGDDAAIFDDPKAMSRSTMSCLATSRTLGASNGSSSLRPVVDLVEKSRPDLGYGGGYGFSPVPKGLRGMRRASAWKEGSLAGSY